MLGKSLYGDDFGPEQVAAWFEDEQQGYFRLAEEHYAGSEGYVYEYAALNRLHAFDALLKRRFGTCLAIGCARGDDVAELAPVVDRFIAIEPARQWWSESIGGKPAEFRSPTLMGDIDLPDGSVDIAVSLGVLHHIPNVSHVIGEIARLLRPGGIFVLREPIVSMGDFREPRVGLTRHERGLPLAWLEETIARSGFTVERRRFCMMNPLALAVAKLGVGDGFNDRWFAYLDWIASELTRWNIRYWRPKLRHKFAPSSAFYILRRLPVERA